MTASFTPCKGSWTPEYRKFLLVESRIQLKKSGMQVPITKTEVQYLESGIPSLESRNQDCLRFPYMEWASS